MSADGIVAVRGTKVQSRLTQMSLKGQVKLDVQVGYSKRYAIYQHENLEYHHTIGQAKFLEVPLRRLRKKMLNMIRSKLLAKRSLEDALTAAGNMLLEASKLLVPVDTGALKKSGYVRIR